MCIERSSRSQKFEAERSFRYFAIYFRKKEYIGASSSRWVLRTRSERTRPAMLGPAQGKERVAGLCCGAFYMKAPSSQWNWSRDYFTAHASRMNLFRPYKTAHIRECALRRPRPLRSKNKVY
jgi:hypothetical protein